MPSVRPLQLGLALSLGLGVGALLQCGGIAAAVGFCSDDSECVLDCDGEGCCGSDCPCANAVNRAEHARLEQVRRDRCADLKIECPAPRAGACDHHTSYRAVCRTGRCSAEAIEGGVPPEFRPPEMPAQIGVDHPDCRVCYEAPGREQGCARTIGWECGSPEACRMEVPCEAACCQALPATAVGLDVDPWGPRLAGPAEPPTGLLVFAAARDSGTNGRLFVADAAQPIAIETAVTLGDIPLVAARIDGTREWVVSRDDGLERVTFPDGARTPMLEDVPTITGIDVAPTGDRLVFARYRGDTDDGLSTLQFDRAIAEPVAGTGQGDTTPRWSPDGKRLAFTRAYVPGRIAIVDSATGRVDGRRTIDELELAAWHPSGQFLLLWLRERTDAGPSCRLVVATIDRARFARTSVQVERLECEPIAVSPDGRHVALWRNVDHGADLEIVALVGSVPSIVVGNYAFGGSIEWLADLDLAAFGLTAD